MRERHERLLGLRKVEDRVNRGKSVIYADMKDGTFPQSIKIGLRSVAWLESEIDEWIEERIRASRGPEREDSEREGGGA